MNLTEPELRLIQRLKLTRKFWPSARWVLLLAGLATLAGCIYFFHILRETLNPDKMLLMLCTFATPLAGILLFLGAAAVGYSLAFWQGRPASKLLLRLVEESQNAPQTH